MTVKKKIGITTRIVNDPDYRIEVIGSTSAYSNAVLAVNAIPVLIPVLDAATVSIADDYADLCDALILTGGEDVAPKRYNESPEPTLGKVCETRDAFEIAVFQAFNRKQKKILGVCRGVQLLNVALGGSLYQDLPSQFTPYTIQHTSDEDRWHEYIHDVQIDLQSFLFKLLQAHAVAVNSIHHQAIKQLAPSLKVTATSADGVIEAVESIEGDRLIGVQWHPETMWQPEYLNQDSQLRLFEWLGR